VTAARAVRAAGATDVGRHRDANEDRFFVDVERGVFIVVDGIGGHAAGETAAETAIAAMRERLGRETGALPDRMREAITIANNEIHRLASSRPEWQGMACVLTAAIVEGQRAVIGHVGDSRLYRLHGDRIEKITPDHSPIGEREDAQEISEAEAMHHPRRHEVYRDVGSEPHEIADPDFVFVADIDLPADAALLLCSDGLTDLVPSETIRQIASARAGSPDDVVRGLIAAANDAGGKDNVTAVFVEGPRFGARRPVWTPARTAAIDRHPRWLWVSVVAAAAFVGLGVGANWDLVTTESGGVVPVLGFHSGPTVVQPGQSIAAAIARAPAGATIVVERGEYREQLTLKNHVRVMSREPRGATIRLPGNAAEVDAAVEAGRVTNAELIGFRIVGDAATPLGVGISARDGAEIRLVDLEISGATTAALELGAGSRTTVIGNEIHDNPGSATIVRTGASVRMTHNSFEKNAFSDRAPAAMLIERGAKIDWSRNQFYDLGPEAIAGTDSVFRALLLQTNVFIGRPATSTRPPGGRGGRGQ
jgi:serine/threonine protein phosphatase PrpC